MPVRIAVLASGNGSNLQAILDACAAGTLPAEVVVVLSNRSDAFALERAAAAGVSTMVAIPGPGQPRAAYDAAIADLVAEHGPDWIVLAGWMRILTMSFLARFPRRVVNLHPARPGELAGTHAIERAYEEAQLGLRSATGVMVHLVPDEGVDSGPVLAWEPVPIEPGDSLADLEARVHAVEHRLLVQTLTTLCTLDLGTPQEATLP